MAANDVEYEKVFFCQMKVSGEQKFDFVSRVLVIKLPVSPQQQIALKEDLLEPCEAEELAEIREVVLRRFPTLNSPRGVFCVSDERFERQNLPTFQTFAGKGVLHSLMGSRRLWFAGDAQPAFTYTISLDNNVARYLRRRVEGKSQPEIDDSLTECIKFLARHRSAVDILPFIFEKWNQLETQDVLDTLYAMVCFQQTPDDVLLRGEIRPNTPEKRLQEIRDEVFAHVKSNQYNAEASKSAQSRCQIVYAVLLAATIVQFSHATKNLSFRTKHLIDIVLQELSVFPEQEFYFALRFLSGTQERFFRPIQKNASKLLGKIRSMAWDLAFHRILADMAVIAGQVKWHADFVVPYVLTFDEGAGVLYRNWPAKAFISYKTDISAGSVVIRSLAYYQELSDAVHESHHLFSPEAAKRRSNRLNSTPGLIDKAVEKLECQLVALVASQK